MSGFTGSIALACVLENLDVRRDLLAGADLVGALENVVGNELVAATWFAIDKDLATPKLGDDLQCYHGEMEIASI